MPRIPQFQGGTPLRTGAASIRPSLAGAVGAATAGLGADIARTAEGFVRQEREAIARQKAADDAAFVTERTNRLIREETERLDGIQTRGEDVDMSTLQSDFGDRLNAISEDAPSQEARNALREQADTIFSRRLFPGYARHQSKLNVGRRVSASQNAVDDIVSEVLTGRTGVPEALARVESAMAGLEETAAGAVDVDALRARARSAVAVNSLTARINQGDQEAVFQEIQAGQWDELTTSEELASLQAQAVKAEVEAEARVQAQVETRNAVTASDLEIAVFRDEATYQDVDRAMAEGIITPSKRTQLTKQLDENAEKKSTAAENLTRVQASLSMGIPLDPTSKDDRAGVEQMWQTYSTQIDNREPENFANSAVSFIQSTGILPDSLKGSLSAFSRSGNAEQASQAADIIGRMQEANSPALNDLTRESYAFGLSVMDLVKGGVDKQQAVEIARKNAFGQTEQEKKVSRLVLKGASADNVTFLNDQLDEFDPGIFSAQPEVTPVLQAEFEVLLNEMVPFTGGNIDQARLMAWQSMRNVWGATTVNGGIQVMKYAPEAIYGKGGNADWIQPQFEAEMAEQGVDEGNAFIAVDTATARAERPSYPVFVKGEDGIARPLLDENNLPMRWRPEFSSSPAYRELQAEQDRRIRAGQFKRTIADTRERWKRQAFERKAEAALEFERATNQ